MGLTRVLRCAQVAMLWAVQEGSHTTTHTTTHSTTRGADAAFTFHLPAWDGETGLLGQLRCRLPLACGKGRARPSLAGAVGKAGPWVCSSCRLDGPRSHEAIAAVAVGHQVWPRARPAPLSCGRVLGLAVVGYLAGAWRAQAGREPLCRAAQQCRRTLVTNSGREDECTPTSFYCSC
jgi:hypothetical protein